MARQLTTKAQVNGYRFLLKRLEHALVRRDVRMLHDPMRSQLRALIVGTVLGLLVLGGCGIWGLVRPQGAVGDATILVSKNSGGMFVLLDGTLHPVLNLASARLITGNSDSPKSVADDKMRGYPRGPLLGIPGAPGGLPGSRHVGTSTWTVCDSSNSAGSAPGESIALTVIGDRPQLSEAIGPARPGDGVLVATGDSTYLIYQLERDGHQMPVRARVDTGDAPVMWALGLDGMTPRRMSAGLLNTFPEVDRLTVPAIDRAGQPGPLAGRGLTIGSVVKSIGLDESFTYHVVVADGLQRISVVTAEILRLADRSTAPVPTVPPGELAAVPLSNSLPVNDFPDIRPRLLEASTVSTLCRTWSRGADEPRSTATLLAGRSLPLDGAARPVALTTSDGPGPAVDAVYLAPGSGEYIQVTGDEPDSPRIESRFYVTDSGVRFGIPDVPTGSILGLGDEPARAPWSVVGLLVGGPTLSRQAALVSHDGLAPDPAGAAVIPPDN